MFLFGLAVSATASLSAQGLTGRWDATLVATPDYSLPFPIVFSTTGETVTATLFNGDEPVDSTAGTFKNGALTVSFGDYDATLEAILSNGVLTGRYGGGRNGFKEFEAHRHVATSTGGAGPAIAGLWEIPHESPKGEKSWYFIVRQNGPEVSAAILRVDGDTGTLRGGWVRDRFVLNLFDGARGSTLEVVPQPDGSLSLKLQTLRGPAVPLVAWRATAARAQGLPEPTDPEHHTRVKDPSEPFRFSFPDVAGTLVANTDPKFRDKVLVVNITGSWCPNCHDEAPFLEALYRRYRSLGLEVVAIDFEDPVQLKSQTRLKAFIKKYGIDYTYLVAGETTELQAKIPQAENLNAWPTTFFIGRDGRGRAVHAGFAAPASGEFNDELVKSVDKLLAKPAPAISANRT